MHTLRALLSGIVDYAGLFPPAKLEMAPTVRNYARFRGEAESWMLGRLVVPVARLEEFETNAAPLLPPGDDDDDEADLWIITALAAPAGDPQLERDLEAIERFNDRHLNDGEGAAFIDAVELRASSPDAIDAVMDRLPEEIFPYFELPLEGAPGGDVRGLVTALAGGEAGAKVRTGGLSPADFPSAKALAHFITACAAADVPFKATAGLHHPIRLPRGQVTREVQAPMHGFLNVFLAACLAWSERIDAAEVESILLIEAASEFRFDDESIAVRGHRLTAERIEAARERFAHSFGSCSFDEPIADLRLLTLLGPVRQA